MEPELLETPEISPELEKRIEKRVRKILNKGVLSSLTEKSVRDIASAKLGIDLSGDPYKYVVRRVVEDFLLRLKEEAQRAKGTSTPSQIPG